MKTWCNKLGDKKLNLLLVAVYIGQALILGHCLSQKLSRQTDLLTESICFQEFIF